MRGEQHGLTGLDFEHAQANGWRAELEVPLLRQQPVVVPKLARDSDGDAVALAEALELYERKGNVAGSRRVSRRSAEETSRKDRARVGAGSSLGGRRRVE